MRRLLAASLLLVLLGRTLPASAQIPVTDGGNLVAQAKNLLQDLKSYATQLQQYATDVQQLAWVTTEANSLIQHPNLGSVMGLMAAAGIENPLPINPYSVMSLTSGLGSTASLSGLASKMSLLGSAFNSSYAVNHVYTCTDDSFACQTQQQQANANAGLQGIVGKIMTDMSNHIPIVNGLRANLASSTDPAQRENVIAQLNAEQAWTQTSMGELNGAIGLYQAQRIANANREDEHLTQDIDAILQGAPK